MESHSPIDMILDIANALRTMPTEWPDYLEFPEDWPNSDLTMSNFDHTIDDGMEEALRAGQTGTHTAWDFNGKVWFKDGMFHEEVWQYREPMEVIHAVTLEELMDAANDKYGYA